MNKRWAIVILLAIVGLLAKILIFPDGLDERTFLPTIPLRQPVDLSTAGKTVDVVVEITEPGLYFFEVDYFFDSRNRLDRKRIANLIGNISDSDQVSPSQGVFISIDTSVFSVKQGYETLVYANKVTNPEVNIIAMNYFGRWIGKQVLDPGVYRIRITNLVNAPELAGTHTEVSIHKSSTK